MMMKNTGTTPQNDGPAGEVEFSYTLSADDVFNALKTSRIYRKNFIKAIVESGVLAGLVVLFGVWWIVWDDGNAMIFCIACACLIGLVWAAVLFSVRSTCNKMVTGQEITMLLREHTISVCTGEAAPWEIPLDGSVICEEKNKLLILHTGKAEWMILPLRSIPEGLRQTVRSQILHKTKRLEK